MKRRRYVGRLRGIQILGILIALLVGAFVLNASGALQVAGILGPKTTTGNFPLVVTAEYQSATETVTVRGRAVPGTVVQVRNESEVVKASGTYAMKTSLPLSLVAVKDGKIRRFRFDLPPKAKPHVSSLVVSADLSKMSTSVAGQLRMTKHPPARVIVHHVEKGSEHAAAITQGKFSLELPLVRGTNTLRWRVQLGIFSSPGPDITFVAE